MTMQTALVDFVETSTGMQSTMSSFMMVCMLIHFVMIHFFSNLASDTMKWLQTGRKISPIEFGNKQKAHRPNDDCEDPFEEEDESVGAVNVLDSCKDFVSLSSSFAIVMLWLVVT